MYLPITKLNSNLTCGLCQGYLINATTVVSCCHSFCKSCLFKYLEHYDKCPVCNSPFNKEEFVSNFKYDSILQSLVYKIVPHLYSNENERRTKFYEKFPQYKMNDDLIKFRKETIFFDPKELIDISIEYLPKCESNHYPLTVTNENSIQSVATARRRYLRVECAMKVAHLKKWIRHKMDLPFNHQVIVLFNNETLSDSFKMIDLAYISPQIDQMKWPLNLYYYYYKITGAKKHSKILKKSKLANGLKLATKQTSKLRNDVVAGKKSKNGKLRKKSLVNNLKCSITKGDKLPVRKVSNEQVENGASVKIAIKKIKKVNFIDLADNMKSSNGDFVPPSSFNNGNSIKLNSFKLNIPRLESTLNVNKRFISSEELNNLNKAKRKQVSKN